MQQQTILDYLKQVKPYYEKKGFIIEGLFGSYARNEATEESDIDILIEIEKKTTDIYVKKKYLKEDLETYFHKKVDLARKKYLTPLAKDAINNDLIYV